MLIGFRSPCRLRDVVRVGVGEGVPPMNHARLHWILSCHFFERIAPRILRRHCTAQHRQANIFWSIESLSLWTTNLDLLWLLLASIVMSPLCVILRSCFQVEWEFWRGLVFTDWISFQWRFAWSSFCSSLCPCATTDVVNHQYVIFALCPWATYVSR